MKQALKYLMIILSIILVTSCSSGTNEEKTEDAAEEVNEERLQSEAEKTAEFIVESYTFSLMLQEYGRTTIEKNNIPTPVLEFAQSSVIFHQNLNRTLEEMSHKTDIVLPITVAKNVEEYREKLNEKEGTEFADEYLKTVSDLLGQMIARYRRATVTSESTTTREFIDSVLPTLEEREDAVVALAEYVEELE